MRRALQAHEQAQTLHADAQRTRELAVLLREAHAGDRLLRYCAWCGCLEVGGEWLHLEAVGSGQYRITSSLIERATNGICPDCFQRTLADSEAERVRRGTTAGG